MNLDDAADLLPEPNHRDAYLEVGERTCGSGRRLEAIRGRLRDARGIVLLY